jgi:hypothetical protein
MAPSLPTRVTAVSCRIRSRLTTCRWLGLAVKRLKKPKVLKVLKVLNFSAAGRGSIFNFTGAVLQAAEWRPVPGRHTLIIIGVSEGRGST